MRFSLVNPNWDFAGSVYFGCRDSHLPLEYGYSKALLESCGHDVQIVDGQLEQLSIDEIRARVLSFETHYSVVTTAPSYLFWRCAPPELRVPAEVAVALRDVSTTLIGVGPHASTTPRSALRKLGVDAVVIGECEEILPQLAGDWSQLSSICYQVDGDIRIQGGVHESDMSALPSLTWDPALIARHSHHHHRFDSEPCGPGAEMETSRGCPYHCTFCAKDNFRNTFRRRPLDVIAKELDGLISAGIEYVYFIDEIFLPYRDLLEMLGHRRVKFGIQTRIDLWKPEMLDLLGRAGCVSIEAGVESITEHGRHQLAKNCKLSTSEISERLLHAKQNVAFVQANLLNCQADDSLAVKEFRSHLQAHGVWANKPVPLFPYPGSPDYTRRWGHPDDFAWERAHEFYLAQFDSFSDIQDQRPASLIQLEAAER
jgi:B12-binding domain/radical SAM domain protein of rhizo-twelve system